MTQTLAASPYAAPAFFLGWAAFGAIVAGILARRGHDPRTMFALGLGLGPLMAIVAVDTVRFREAEVGPIVLDQAVARSGTIDVIVLVSERPEAVRSVNATLTAIRQNLRTVTLARAVPYEWIEDDTDRREVAAAAAALTEADRYLAVPGAGRALWPGTAQAVGERFRSQHAWPLLLVAIDEYDDEQVTT